MSNHVMSLNLEAFGVKAIIQIYKAILDHGWTIKGYEIGTNYIFLSGPEIFKGKVK